MKRKLTVTKDRATRLAWNDPCGCPLFEQLEERGFRVSRVDTFTWTDTYGKTHKLHPAFRLYDYIEVLKTGKPFKTTTSDRD